MNFSEIKHLFDEGGNWTSLKAVSPELKERLNGLDLPAFFTLPEKIWHIKTGKIRPVCITCGSPNTNFISINHGFRQTCSRSCQAKTDKAKGAAAKIGRNLETISKRSSSRKRNYYEPFSKSVSGMKLLQTQEEYINNSSGRFDWQCLQCSAVCSNALVGRAVCRVCHPFTSNEDIQNKRRVTTKKKYGLEHNLQDPSIIFRRAISKKTNAFQQIVVPGFELLSSEEDYVDSGNHGKYNWKCIGCNTHIENRSKFRLVCRSCNPIQSAYSLQELEFADWISSVVPIKRNDRSILSSLELDIVVPDRKIAIEYNGIYWHSFPRKEVKYHQIKSILARAAGYHLIHIFEHEWLTRPDYVKSFILGQLGYNEKIGARDCQVKELSFSQVKNFLIENHFQGAGTGGKAFGLFFQDELVSCMTFSKPRFDKTCQWELIRYVTKLGLTIQGGMSRLLAAFVKAYSPESILSYVDFSKFSGTGYTKTGFVETSMTAPGYFYVDDSLSVIPRYAAQPKRLNALAGTQGKTEREFAIANGWFQIFNSGNLKMVYSRS